MNFNTFLLLLEIGTLVIFVFGIFVSALLIYLTFFKGGYSYFVEKEKKNNRIKKNQKILETAPPIGDWGGDGE